MAAQHAELVQRQQRTYRRRPPRSPNPLFSGRPVSAVVAVDMVVVVTVVSLACAVLHPLCRRRTGGLDKSAKILFFAWRQGSAPGSLSGALCLPRPGSSRCRPEQAVQVVVDDLGGGLVAALPTEDTGGQAVGESQKAGDFGTRVTIGGDVPGLLRGDQP